MHWLQPMTSTRLLLIPCFIVLSLQLAAQSYPGQDSGRIAALNEVVVTGLFGTATLKQSVFKIRTINQATILARAANDTYSLLAAELGIRLHADHALGETDLSILGMGGNNIKILVNGIPLLDRGSTRQSLGQIDINSIERIELVEGPMSVLYGSDALAGVVNIITKNASAKTATLAVQAKLQEESMGQVYAPFSGNGIHQRTVAVSQQTGKIASNAYLTSIEMGGWKGAAPLRAREIRPKQQLLTGFSTAYQSGNWKLLYRLDYLHEEIYAPGQYNQNNTAVDAYYKTNRQTHQLSADWQAHSKLLIQTAFSYQQYQRTTSTYRLNFLEGTKEPSTNAGEWDEARFNAAFARITARWNWTSWLKLQPGLEFKSEQGMGDRISGSPRITDYSVFLTGEVQPLKPLLIRPGLRMNRNSQYDAPPVISSINAKYQFLPNWDIRASYGRGFRAPALRELYFQFFDANHAIEGNPELKAESSDSYQASISWQPEKAANKADWKFSLSAFYNNFRDRITLAQGSGNLFTYFNLDRFKTKGTAAELQFNYRRFTLQTGLLVIGRFNAYYGNDTYQYNGTSAFAWSPEANLNLRYTIPAWALEAAVFYKFNGKLPVFTASAVAGQEKQQVYLAETASYHWGDFNLTKTIGPYLRLQAGVKNIFNVSRINNTATAEGSAHTGSGPVLLSYGRSWFSSLQFNWSKQNKKKNAATSR